MLSEKPKGGLSEARKMTKSTMEKKRRARINDSLAELKSILSGMVPHKGERFDKMEKADILELTVKCVRQLQKQAGTSECARPSGPNDNTYRSGVNTCMSEVIKFISSSSFSDTDPEVKTKILDHLATSLSTGRQRLATASTRGQETFPNVPVNEASLDSSVDEDRFRSTSAVSSDSNNNSQAVDNKNGACPAFIQVQSPTVSLSPQVSPVLASYKPIEHAFDKQNIPNPSNVQTVPLTILVPANFCSSPLGTTCVIPLSFQNTYPQDNRPQLLTGHASLYTSEASPTASVGISLVNSPNLAQNTFPSTTNVLVAPQTGNSSFIALAPLRSPTEVLPSASDSAFVKATSDKLVSPSFLPHSPLTSKGYGKVSSTDKCDNLPLDISTKSSRQTLSSNEMLRSSGLISGEVYRDFSERGDAQRSGMRESVPPHTLKHPNPYPTQSLYGRTSVHGAGSSMNLSTPRHSGASDSSEQAIYRREYGPSRNNIQDPACTSVHDAGSSVTLSTLRQSNVSDNSEQTINGRDYGPPRNNFQGPASRPFSGGSRSMWRPW